MNDETASFEMKAKVAAILAVAQHPNTPQAEAETALAMAWKLMQKYGIDEAAAKTRNTISGKASLLSREIVSEAMSLRGLYRVRRGDLLYQIAKANCCAGYRDLGESDAIRYVFFGTEFDLANTRALFAAAEMLALRVMPRGDRSWRTSWWHGFTRGIIEKLHIANREFVREHKGENAAIALVERSEHAETEMKSRINFGLRSTRGYISGSMKAFTDGQRAAGGFYSGKNSVDTNLPRSLNR